MIHADGELLVDFKVQVRGVHSMVVADHSDLLSLVHLLSLADINPVEMGIQGVGEFQLPVFYPGMADDDNVSPGGMDVTGQDYETVSDRVHRFSETFFAAAVSHEPVLSQMAAASEAARRVVAVSVRRGHRKVEPVGRFGDALGAGRKQASPKKQEGGAQR